MRRLECVQREKARRGPAHKPTRANSSVISTEEEDERAGGGALEQTELGSSGSA